MKFYLSLALLASALAFTNASYNDCYSHYGPPPDHSGGGGYGGGSGGGGGGGGYVPPPPPTPYHARALTSYDPRCQQYGYWRNLEERDLKVVTTHELVSSHGDACADAQYDIYLVIQGAHFAGLGVPVGDKYASCPNLVMHSRSEKNGRMEKIVMIAGDKEVALVAEEEKYHVGSRSLSDIVAAFDNVEAGKNGAKIYDAITNNCVSLLRNMADPLDIKIDDGMIKFVSNRMLQGTADHIFEAIRESPAMKTLFEGGKRFLKGVSKEDLLARIIKLYV